MPWSALIILDRKNIVKEEIILWKNLGKITIFITGNHNLGQWIDLLKNKTMEEWINQLKNTTEIWKNQTKNIIIIIKWINLLKKNNKKEKAKMLLKKA